MLRGKGAPRAQGFLPRRRTAEGNALEVTEMIVLYQIVKGIMLPPALLVLVLFVGFGLSFSRFRRLGHVVLALGIFSLYLLSIAPIADLLVTPLESRYQPLSPTRVPRTGTVVLLSGGGSATSDLPTTSRLTLSSIGRVLEAVRLYGLMDHPTIVISGGSGNPLVEVSEAALMAELLLHLRVPERDILMESESSNTFENATEVKGMALKTPLILVTSASHMYRALRVFRGLDMTPLPAPCNYKGRWDVHNPLRFLPSAGALATSAAAMYEYVGIFWYKLTGKF
jgi:uncharacterized SAM-binding protein YcdF (DUF218 family)